MSRTPHGVRGLKLLVLIDYVTGVGRTPHGVRGLKSVGLSAPPRMRPSHPSRGAWIEIRHRSHIHPERLSHPSRGAWIEMRRHGSTPAPATSHPSRGAWIEIGRIGGTLPCLAGRTPHGVRGLKLFFVAPACRVFGRTPHGVRGLKFVAIALAVTIRWSHPSRGAWIEITRPDDLFFGLSVAPLTGCVD